MPALDVSPFTNFTFAAPNHGKGIPALIQACQALNYREVTSLLKSASRDQVNGGDSTGRTGLHALAASSSTIVPPAEAGCGCFGGSAPVQDACTAIAQGLLSAGADPDAQDNTGSTPLMVACASGRVAVIEELLSRSKMQTANVKGETAVMVLMRSALAEPAMLGFVQRMVKSGAAVNHAAADGQTPLMYAAAKGKLKVVSFLVESGAKVNDKDGQQRTALALSVAGKHAAVSLALLEKGAWDASSAVVNQRIGKGGQSQLHVACANGDAERVAALLAAKANDNGLRPLHMCPEVSCATLLIERGADVNAMDRVNNTALHVAARKGAAPLVKLLLANDAKANIHNVHGSTPLHSALEGLCKTSEHKNAKATQEICLLLLNHGADANAQDTNGIQPLDCAHVVSITGIITPASLEIVELLKSHGARLSLTWQVEIDILPGNIMARRDRRVSNGGGTSAPHGGSLGKGSGKHSMKSHSGKISMGRNSMNKVVPHGGSINGNGSMRVAAKSHKPDKLDILLGRSIKDTPSGGGGGGGGGRRSSRTGEGDGIPMQSSRARLSNSSGQLHLPSSPSSPMPTASSAHARSFGNLSGGASAPAAAGMAVPSGDDVLQFGEGRVSTAGEAGGATADTAAANGVLTMKSLSMREGEQARLLENAH